jgi:hypothetical protein
MVLLVDPILTLRAVQVGIELVPVSREVPLVLKLLLSSILLVSVVVLIHCYFYCV